MKKRSIALMILFSILTAGIYMIYWQASFQGQLKEKTGKGFNGVVHVIMLMITFGFYGLYWQYAAGKRLAELGASDNSLLYLILCFVGGIGAMINPWLMQSQANKLN